MKKRFVAILLILVLVLAAGLTACGGNDDDNDGGDGTFEYGTDYIESHLGTNYLVAYTITTHDGGSSASYSMELRRTENGYYMVDPDQSDDGILYIKGTGGYYEYAKNETGVYEKHYDTAISETTLSLYIGSVTVYMSIYAGYGATMQRNGSETIAGRDCAKYSYDYNYPGYGKYKQTYCVDKETGVCLKFTVEWPGSSQKSGAEFLCTKFQKGGVTLPAYTQSA